MDNGKEWVTARGTWWFFSWHYADTGLYLCLQVGNRRCAPCFTSCVCVCVYSSSPHQSLCTMNKRLLWNSCTVTSTCTLDFMIFFFFCLHIVDAQTRPFCSAEIQQSTKWNSHLAKNHLHFLPIVAPQHQSCNCNALSVCCGGWSAEKVCWPLLCSPAPHVHDRWWSRRNSAKPGGQRTQRLSRIMKLFGHHNSANNETY